jgi:hypothetical protein
MLRQEIRLSTSTFFIPSPTKLRRNIVTLPSFRSILVNTLESTSFNGFWPNLVHTSSLRESETLLIFKVIVQRSRSLGQCFLPRNILVNTRINILQWILTKLGTCLVLMWVWNPIDFQGHRSKIKVIGSNFYPVTSLWTL